MRYWNICFSFYYNFCKEEMDSFLKMWINLNFSFLEFYSKNSKGFWIETSSHFIHSKLFIIRYTFSWASLVPQRLKRLPSVWETGVRSLGWEDPLEKEMVTHSGILAWRIPWTEEPGRLQSTGSQRIGHDWVTSLFTFILSLVLLQLKFNLLI